MLVEGVRATGEALNAGVQAEFAVVSPRLGSTSDGRTLRDRLAGLDVHEVDDEELALLSDTEEPQGVLLICAEPRIDLAHLRNCEKILVLDAVQDPGNVGTLLRSAVAFGFDGAICLDGTADPWSAKVVRASAGAVFRLFITGSAIHAALDWLREHPVRLLVASSDGISLARLRPEGDRPLALVLGNEGAGVRPELRAAADAMVAVAMHEAVESLNVGVAGSILMHELSRREEP